MPVANAATDDVRLQWAAVWCFYLANWVYQDYLSPQGLTYALYLANQSMGMALITESAREEISRRWSVDATVLPLLQEAGRGASVINVGSIAGRLAYPGGNVYGATKAFVLSFTESLWEETRDTGLRVLAVCPGATRTEFYDAAGSQSADLVAAGLPARASRPEGVDAKILYADIDLDFIIHLRIDKDGRE